MGLKISDMTPTQVFASGDQFPIISTRTGSEQNYIVPVASITAGQVNVPPGLTGNGIVNDGAIIAAYSAALASNSELWLPHGTYLFTTNTTIASRVRFMRGAVIKAAAGVTVSITGGIEADTLSQIFDVSASASYCWASNGRVTQYSWGAVGDNVVDDTAPFQHLINNQVFHQFQPIMPQVGQHKVASVLIVNLSDSPQGVSWIGPGSGYNSSPTQFGGLTLNVTHYESAIEVQGARAMLFTGTELIGPFISMFDTTLFGNGNTPTADPYDRTKWLPVGASPLCLSRYKMSAGLHIDPRCGSKPTAAAWVTLTAYTYGTSVTRGGNLYVCYQAGTSSAGPSGAGGGAITDGTCVWLYAGASTTSIAYSDITYPAWSGVVTQYNKPLSSDIKIIDCWIHGFGAGVAVKGCNANGNADFVRLRRSVVNKNVYAFTWGHDQARLQGVDDCVFAEAYSQVSTGVIGQQSGQAHCDFRNTQVGNALIIVDMPNTGVGGGVQLHGCYGEVVNKISTMVSNGPSGAGLTMTGGAYSFLQSVWLRVPDCVIDTTGCNLVIDNSEFSGMMSPLVIRGDPNMVRVVADIPNQEWMTGAANPVSISVGQAIAMRSTSGVMFLNDGSNQGSQGPWDGSVRNSSQYSVSTGGTRQNIPASHHARSRLSDPIPFCARTVAHWNADSAEALCVALGGPTYTFTGGVSSITYLGRTATLTLTGGATPGNIGVGLNQGVEKGGVIYHAATGNLFVIETRVASVITMKQVNNLVVNATFENSTPVIASTSAGNWFAIATGHYTSAIAWRLSWTSGSANVTIADNTGSTTGSAAEFPQNAAKCVSNVGSDLSTTLQTNSFASGVQADGTIALNGNANRTAVTSAGLWLIPR